MPPEYRTFVGAIDNLSGWSNIRFGDSESRLLIEHCLAVLRSPHEAEDVVQHWNTFIDAIQPKVQERLKSTDWSNTEGQALVLLSKASIEIRKGIRNFLSPGFNQALSDADKEALWAWYLLNQGMFLQQDPYCLLEPSCLFFMAGPYADREIMERALKHPIGFAAGTFAYFSKSDDGKATLGAEDVMTAALKRIGRSARKKIPTAIMPKRDEGKTALGVSYNKLGPLEEHVGDTLLRDFFRGTGEEILARSLDGLLNVVPQAVAMDVIDKNKSEKARFARTVDLESNVRRKQNKDGREINFRIEDVVDQLYQTASAENIFLASEMVQKIATQYPKEWRLIYALNFEGISVKVLSKKAGVQPTAIKKAYARAKKTLRDWLDDLK